MAESKGTVHKGTAAEYLVISELLRQGAEVYTPVVDVGTDAIVKKGDRYLRIQVKSTEAYNQAGYFNVPSLGNNGVDDDGLFIVCVDVSDAGVREKSTLVSDEYEEGMPGGVHYPRNLPNVWVLTAAEFRKYETSDHQLSMYEGSEAHGGEKRWRLLKDSFRA